MPMACLGFVLWIRVGDKKKRKKERNLWYSTMELIANKAVLSISLVEMGVQGAVVQTWKSFIKPQKPCRLLFKHKMKTQVIYFYIVEILFDDNHPFYFKITKILSYIAGRP
jgi:hypothetical protein